jgi:hypothetical protein
LNEKATQDPETLKLLWQLVDFRLRLFGRELDVLLYEKQEEPEVEGREENWKMGTDKAVTIALFASAVWELMISAAQCK